MTYGEAGEARTAIGSGLLHFGLAPGATVGLYSVNCRGTPAPLAWTGRLAALNRQSAFEALRRLGAGGLGVLGLLDGVGAAVRHAGAGRGALHLRPRRARRSRLRRDGPCPRCCSASASARPSRWWCAHVSIPSASPAAAG